MCGRFVFVPTVQMILAEFGDVQIKSEPKPSYNIAPTQKASVLFQKEEETVLDSLAWGFHAGTNPIINSRVEGINEKPIFKKAFAFLKLLYISSIVPICFPLYNINA